MIRKYAWTIFITHMISGTFGIVVGMSDFTWWGNGICSAVGFGVCLYVWTRKMGNGKS